MHNRSKMHYSWAVSVVDSRQRQEDETKEEKDKDEVVEKGREIESKTSIDLIVNFTWATRVRCNPLVHGICIVMSFASFVFRNFV